MAPVVVGAGGACSGCIGLTGSSACASAHEPRAIANATATALGSEAMSERTISHLLHLLTGSGQTSCRQGQPPVQKGAGRLYEDGACAAPCPVCTTRRSAAPRQTMS